MGKPIKNVVTIGRDIIFILHRIIIRIPNDKISAHVSQKAHVNNFRIAINNIL